MKIVFSIITVTYNRAGSGYLERCIKSIQDQVKGDYDYEHIIIDDGSTDDTAEYIADILSKDKRIKYYYKENAGLAKGLRRGIELAEGEYLFKIDDDDELPSDSLLNRYKYIIENPNTDWFYGLARWIDEFGLPTQQLYQSKFYEDYAYERMLISNYIHGGTETIKSSVAKSINWPDWLTWSQDYYLWLELLRPQRKLKYGFLEKNILLYRYHSNSYTANINSVKKKKEKDEINARIKELHESSLAFLAEQAYRNSEEARLNNQYLKNDINKLNKTINDLYQHIENYEKSRYISKAIKIRNVASAQRIRLLQNTSRVKQKVKSANTNTRRTAIVDLEKWPSTKPLVTVVSPFYNRADTMPETIRSVLSQTFRNFEYIIVDDGSSDKDSVEYITQIVHPKIKVIKQNNQGVAAARNNGISKAKGKYVVCVDSDDILDPTFIEKAVLAMELDPEVGFVTCDMQMFGELNDAFTYPRLNPLNMLKDNYVITAAVFRKEAWEATNGYKNGIGYEDWEFWVNITEKGYFGLHIPEKLFHYRTAKRSRYIDDLLNHHFNSENIKRLHPNFEKNIKNIYKEIPAKQLSTVSDPYLNVSEIINYTSKTDKPNVLIVIPWMPVGGAETLTLTFCGAIKDLYNFHFITGVESKNEWEDRFKTISKNIYHLPHITNNSNYQKGFIKKYIKTRKIDILHIVHSGYTFRILEEIKNENKGLKIITTLFNDRVPEYVSGVVNNQNIIDAFSSDNNKTMQTIKTQAPKINKLSVIPNAVDALQTFNPDNVESRDISTSLRLTQNDFVVLFVGRLSEEKNPDVFIEAAAKTFAEVPEAKIKFIVIGDGPMLNELQRANKRLNNPRIELIGYSSSIAEHLKAADVFVLPSKIEGFPLSLLEAMSMGVVPIASAVGAVPEVIDNGKNGYVITPGSTDEIKKHIIDLYNDQGKLSNLKKAARKDVVEKYSVERLRLAYDKLYRSVLK